MTYLGESVRGWKVEMRPWAQIIRERGKKKNIQIHSTAQTHQGTFPQTYTDLVAAGIGINTSNITREKFKRETVSTCDRGTGNSEIKRLNSNTACSTDVVVLGNLQTQDVTRQLFILEQFN